MKRFVVILALLCSLGLLNREAWAQVIDSIKVNQSSLLQPPPYLQVLRQKEMPPILCFFGTMPVFAGGNAYILDSVAAHTHYPATATKTGRVFVSFLVTKTGEIADAKVIEGLEPVLDAEAVRVVNSLGRFTPASDNGRPVAIPYTLPVSFPPVIPEPAKHRKKRKS